MYHVFIFIMIYNLRHYYNVYHIYILVLFQLCYYVMILYFFVFNFLLISSPTYESQKGLDYLILVQIYHCLGSDQYHFLHLMFSIFYFINWSTSFSDILLTSLFFQNLHIFFLSLFWRPNTFLKSLRTFYYCDGFPTPLTKKVGYNLPLVRSTYILLLLSARSISRLVFEVSAPPIIFLM